MKPTRYEDGKQSVAVAGASLLDLMHMQTELAALSYAGRPPSRPLFPLHLDLASVSSPLLPPLGAMDLDGWRRWPFLRVKMVVWWEEANEHRAGVVG